MEPKALSFAISAEARRQINSEAPGEDHLPEFRSFSGLVIELRWRPRVDLRASDHLVQNDLGDIILSGDTSVGEALEGSVLHFNGTQYEIVTRVQGQARLSKPASQNPITAAKVRRLRDQTGAGMMDCKRALEATAGDLAAARRLIQRGR